MTQQWIWAGTGGISARADQSESIADRHQRVIAGLSNIDPPYGLRGLPPPPPPPSHCNGNMSAGFTIHEGRDVTVGASYKYRGPFRDPAYTFNDDGDFDDVLFISMSREMAQQAYSSLIESEMPKLIEAFGGYGASAQSWETGKYLDRLMPGGSADGRAHYTYAFNPRSELGYLRQIHFWDGLLCHRLFGFGPEEVMRRLEGQVPLVRPLGDGAYVVFRDQLDLTFDEFVDMNERFRSILGVLTK